MAATISTGHSGGNYFTSLLVEGSSPSINNTPSISAPAAARRSAAAPHPLFDHDIFSADQTNSTGQYYLQVDDNSSLATLTNDTFDGSIQVSTDGANAPYLAGSTFQANGTQLAVLGGTALTANATWQGMTNAYNPLAKSATMLVEANVTVPAKLHAGDVCGHTPHRKVQPLGQPLRGWHIRLGGRADTGDDGDADTRPRRRGAVSASSRAAAAHCPTQQSPMAGTIR